MAYYVNGYSVPPSYAEAVSRDVWALIVPRLPLKTLSVVSRLNSYLHKLSSPVLWACPTQLEGQGAEEELQYGQIDLQAALRSNAPLLPCIDLWTQAQVRLERFQCCMRRTRPCILALVQRLCIIGCCLEEDTHWQTSWLAALLERLPNLRCACFIRLPALDHQAIVNAVASADLSSYRLSQVTTHRCDNVTSSALLQFLLRVPNLQYLDLTSTRAAKDSSILQQFSSLKSLQILILRNIKLQDEDNRTLISAIHPQVSYLDLSHNSLTHFALQDWAEWRRSRHFDDEGSGIMPGQQHASDIWPACAHNGELGSLACTSISEQAQTTRRGVLDLSCNFIDQAFAASLLPSLTFDSLDIGQSLSPAFRTYASKSSPSLMAVWRPPLVPSHLTTLRIDFLALKCLIWDGISCLNFFRNQSDEDGIPPNSLPSYDESGIAHSHILFPRMRHFTVSQVPEYMRSLRDADALISLIKFASAAQSRQNWPNHDCPWNLFSTAIVGLVYEFETCKESTTVSQEVDSYTGDADGRKLWTAHAADFSFFHSSHSSGPNSLEAKIRMEAELRGSDRHLGLGRSPEGINVRDMLKSYRQERHKAWLDANEIDKQSVEGFWPGLVRMKYSGQPILRHPQLKPDH